VTQDPASGYYGVGPTAIALGLAGLRSANVVREAATVLPTVRDDTGETALLALWTGSAPVVVMLEESSRPVFMNVRVGSVLPLMLTASGRLFAAYLPKNEADALIRMEAQSASPTHRDLYRPTAIEALLDSIKVDGVASIDGMLVPGVCALAAPIFDHRGRIVAAIGALGRSEEMELALSGRVALALTKAGISISSRLGFHREGE
jgi:DNA-binding IclR family transcriptional regulator